MTAEPSDSTSDDRVAKALAARLSDNAAVHVPRLLKAVEAVLALPAEWEAESDRLDDLAGMPGADDEGRPVMSGQAIAYKDCADELRTAIEPALTGEDPQ